MAESVVFLSKSLQGLKLALYEEVTLHASWAVNGCRGNMSAEEDELLLEEELDDELWEEQLLDEELDDEEEELLDELLLDEELDEEEEEPLDELLLLDELSRSQSTHAPFRRHCSHMVAEDVSKIASLGMYISVQAVLHVLLRT